MILIAFTNFDNAHQPPGNLFTWAGLSNFKTLLLSGQKIAQTFWPVLGWTLVWAVLATFLNYIGGILLALLINREGTRFKGLWRTIFVISIAIPQFVSLLVIRVMLNNDGAINQLLRDVGIIGAKDYLPFLSDPTWARASVIVVNLWVGIPYTMLVTTGILQNIPKELYEAAKVDGANPFVIFVKITMPYVFFVTTPYLITQFIGNINNFNVIYFLTGGGPLSLDYYQAGKTDLLVTWLYKLTTGTMKDYSYASAIGIIVFILSAVFSLIAYRRTSSYKREEDFQ
jgi:arabinogalactan oligomer/maltooligosaccharide transport system permease protein